MKDGREVSDLPGSEGTYKINTDSKPGNKRRSTNENCKQILNRGSNQSKRESGSVLREFSDNELTIIATTQFEPEGHVEPHALRLKGAKRSVGSLRHTQLGIDVDFDALNAGALHVLENVPQQVIVYTDDKKALLEAISQSDERLSATELVNGERDRRVITPARGLEETSDRHRRQERDELTYDR
jgi:hypothetical protein